MRPLNELWGVTENAVYDRMGQIEGKLETFERSLRFHDGRFVEILEPGRCGMQRLFLEERIETVDVSLRALMLQA